MWARAQNRARVMHVRGIRLQAFSRPREDARRLRRQSACQRMSSHGECLCAGMALWARMRTQRSEDQRSRGKARLTHSWRPRPRTTQPHPKPTIAGTRTATVPEEAVRASRRIILIAYGPRLLDLRAHTRRRPLDLSLHEAKLDASTEEYRKRAQNASLDCAAFNQGVVEALGRALQPEAPTPRPKPLAFNQRQEMPISSQRRRGKRGRR